MLASVTARVRDAIFPPDPGILRLRAALQATLAGLLTFCAVVLLGELIPVPLADRILGFAIGLFASVIPRDSSKAQQAMTMALVPPVGVAGTAAATLLLHQPLLAAVLMPCIVFVVTYAGAHQARWGALGGVGLIAYVIGLVTRLPPDTLPVRVLIVCIGAASAALFRFVVLSDSPERELRRLRRDIWRGIARLLGCIEVAMDAGSWTRASRFGLQRQQDRLTTLIMLAQARVWAMALPPPGLGLHLLELELATERVAHAAQHDLGAEAGRSELRAAIARLRTGLDSARLPEMPSERPSSLGRALAGLAHVLHEPPSAGSGPEPPPSAPPISGLRQATQGILATALAVAAGSLVSPQRWYWAAYAAFAMFQGTRSRGESIAKEMQFVLGTLAGVFAGVLLAVALNGHDLLTMAAIVGAVFLAWQAFPAAYAMMIFWITIVLGLMFGMLGYFPPALLLLRLQETAAGAICGIIVVCIVMTRPTRLAADDATIALLHVISQAVGAAARLLLGEPADPVLPSAVLEIESRFAALRATARPELLGLGIARHGRLRRRMVLLSACVAWTRSLGRLSLDGMKVHEPIQADAIRTLVQRIEHTVSGLKNAGDVVRTDTDAGTQSEGETSTARAIRRLRLIDLTLTHIAATLTPRTGRPL